MLAIASGTLLSLSFPSAGLFPLAFVALVPLLSWLHRTTPRPNELMAPPAWGRATPWIAGAVFNALTFWWLLKLPARAMTHPWVIYPGLVALALYLGAYVAVFGWIVRFVRRRLGWSVLVVTPAAWGVSEWLKSSGSLGCPWGNISYALAAHPAWIQGASLVGAPGVSIWIVAVNSLLAGCVTARRAGARVALFAIAALGVALPVAWGANRIDHAPAWKRMRVAMVQPNIGSEEKWDAAHQERSVTTLARLTLEACAATPKPDLILWPETALPFYVRLEPAKLSHLLDLGRQAGVPILAGYPDASLTTSGGLVTHNSAGLVLPAGVIAGQYDKMHPVPFGERIPFQEVFPFLGRIDLGQAEWTPGTEPTLFTARFAPFGVLICFESIFPDLARRYALDGAQFLVNITNDQWFGPTAAPVQHAEMAIVRCVENGVGMARCANTGISMLVDPMGRVTARTGLFREALLQGDVALGVESTLFRRWGDWLTALCLGLVILLVALAWFRPIEQGGGARVG
jgi:apolipoprotein N-acyltransferase